MTSVVFLTGVASSLLTASVFLIGFIELRTRQSVESLARRDATLLLETLDESNASSGPAARIDDPRTNDVRAEIEQLDKVEDQRRTAALSLCVAVLAANAGIFFHASRNWTPQEARLTFVPLAILLALHLAVTVLAFLDQRYLRNFRRHIKSRAPSRAWLEAVRRGASEDFDGAISKLNVAIARIPSDMNERPLTQSVNLYALRAAERAVADRDAAKADRYLEMIDAGAGFSGAFHEHFMDLLIDVRRKRHELMGESTEVVKELVNKFNRDPHGFAAGDIWAYARSVGLISLAAEQLMSTNRGDQHRSRLRMATSALFLDYDPSAPTDDLDLEEMRTLHKLMEESYREGEQDRTLRNIVRRALYRKLLQTAAELPEASLERRQMLAEADRVSKPLS